jgi:hypothetical protein
MPRGPMSDEQREVNAERLAKARAVKAAKNAPEPSPEPKPEPVQPAETHDEYQDLMKRFKELESFVHGLQSAMSHNVGMQGPQVNQRGHLIGTFEKYLVDPKMYDDPRERLSEERRLGRFNLTGTSETIDPMRHDYFLDWDISVTQYETKDGVSTKEPKFTLKLNRIMMDEETGEHTDQAYTVCQMIFHEDPQAALIVAREQGVDPDTFDQKAFLNEMRYIRMRDWLIEAFYPPRSTAVKRKKEMVIGNKLVQVFEISSENSQPIPFDQLKPTKGL